MKNQELISLLGQRIRSERMKLGLSQEAFADKAGVHRTYMSLIERGKNNVTLINYAKIVDALGLSLHELFYFPESSASEESDDFSLSG